MIIIFGQCKIPTSLDTNFCYFITAALQKTKKKSTVVIMNKNYSLVREKHSKSFFLINDSLHVGELEFY